MYTHFLDLNLFSKAIPISSISDCLRSNPKPSPNFFLLFKIMLASSVLSLASVYCIDGKLNRSRLFNDFKVDFLNESLKTEFFLNLILDCKKPLLNLNFVSLSISSKLIFLILNIL